MSNVRLIYNLSCLILLLISLILVLVNGYLGIIAAFIFGFNIGNRNVKKLIRKIFSNRGMK